jgi:hypothetical protein
MAAKSRLRNNRNRALKSSFVVTFSAVAAGLAGCGNDIQMGSAPKGAGAGGHGGSAGSGGQGAVSGSDSNPPPPEVCPFSAPAHDTPCGPKTLVCDYGNGLTDDPCDDEQPMRASCVNGAWDVEELFSTCNPPPPDALDAGFIDVDEDAG